MFLVMGITGKVGGAAAEHLLAQGRNVRALVRNREKAAYWANRGVELADGDWNDSAAIRRALNGVDGAFVMLPVVWAPSPNFTEAKGVIASYVEALTRAPRDTLAHLYALLDEPYFAHDFENVEYQADDFDLALGARGLHTVRRRVEWVERQSVLPPGLFERFAGDMFWRLPEASLRNVPIIRCVD